MLAQVSVAGGEVSTIPTPTSHIYVLDISQDHSQLLISTVPTTGREAPFWSLPLPTGSPRRLGDVMGNWACWSPDGKHLLFIRGESFYLADADGSNPRPLFSFHGYAYFAYYSPDGTRIRFTLQDDRANTSSIWEVRADGTALHQIAPAGTTLGENAAAAGLRMGATTSSRAERFGKTTFMLSPTQGVG